MLIVICRYLVDVHISWYYREPGCSRTARSPHRERSCRSEPGGLLLLALARLGEERRTKEGKSTHQSSIRLRRSAEGKKSVFVSEREILTVSDLVRLS